MSSELVGVEARIREIYTGNVYPLQRALSQFSNQPLLWLTGSQERTRQGKSYFTIFPDEPQEQQSSD